MSSNVKKLMDMRLEIIGENGSAARAASEREI